MTIIAIPTPSTDPIMDKNNSGLDLYLPIQKTDTVFSQILEKLYKDNEFQKNILRLENGIEKDKKKATIIKRTVSKVRVYGNMKNPLLLARDVGILMGISNIRLQLKYYSSSEKVIGLYQLNNGKTSEVEYLTWKGFIRAASNSRSTLSDLFREFIYELVAEAIGDPSLLDKITKRVVDQNPELVKQAMTELDENMEYYRILYERESLKRQLLQEGLNNEIQMRLVAERKQADAELEAITKNYKIQQMAKYTKQYELALLDVYEWPETNVIELNILRQRFMKPLYIYAPSSKLYKDCILKESNYEENNITMFGQYIPEYADRIDYIVSRSAELINDSNGVSINIMKCLLQESDFCYFYVHLGPMQQKVKQEMEDYIHVATEWMLDKKHYESVIEEMNKECEKITIKKKNIYYSSLEEMRHIISQKMIDQEVSNK